MENRRREHRAIDPRVEIGRVHLDVENLDRALTFYQQVLGFTVTQRLGASAVYLGTTGGHYHIGLNTGRQQIPPPEPAVRPQFSVRYPNRQALADAYRRLSVAGIPLEGASDQGTGEALYVRDPDGHRLELYYERPEAAWPRDAGGNLQLLAQPLDLHSLRAASEVPAGVEGAPIMSEATRTRLRDVRMRLLNLHKVLLEDAKAAYELDRGRIESNASLLQLVINDPWFAWLHPLSELVVRMDETLQPDAPASDADGAVLLEQVERLLTPAQSADPFAQRYHDALQRQPAVIVAHAEVRRVLKQAK